jgi:hypothetical protein
MSTRFVVRDITLTERRVAFSHPFRFGAVTVDGAPEAVVHVEIEFEDGRRSAGASAELMVPKWFNKNPALSADDTVTQLRCALEFARELYLKHPFDSAFGLHAACYEHQIARCARSDIPALAAAFGPAEIDKAILDAVLRAHDLDFAAGMKANIAGLDARLTPDIDHAIIENFLASRHPVSRILVRHTVGMLDPVEELADIHETTGCRYFKIKLSGDPAKDRARLADIIEALDDLGIDYRMTLDANEQYPSRKTLAALVDVLLNDDAFASSMAQRLLYIEQPLPRELTWDVPLGDLGKSFAFIIDEADSGYDAFPRALKLGYRGISSKACKGFYKSLLNGARAAYWNAMGSARAFITAEDLTCQAGLAIQQDTALIAFHGLVHAERNGHHYGNGFAAASPEEAQRFLAAHPDLYRRQGDQVRLHVQDGAISFGSLAGRAGFASGVDPRCVGRPAVGTASDSRKEYGT